MRLLRYARNDGRVARNDGADGKHAVALTCRRKREHGFKQEQVGEVRFALSQADVFLKIKLHGLADAFGQNSGRDVFICLGG